MEFAVIKFQLLQSREPWNKQTNRTKAITMPNNKNDDSDRTKAITMSNNNNDDSDSVGVENETTANNHPSKRMKLANNSQDDDIIEINAGVIETHRSTAADSQARTAKRERVQREEGLSIRAKSSSSVAAEDKTTIIETQKSSTTIGDDCFESILAFLPLDQLIFLRSLSKDTKRKVDEMVSKRAPQLDVSNLEFIPSHEGLVDVIKSENKIELTCDRVDYYEFAACNPSLETSGEGSSWKITIEKLPILNSLDLGIIGNINPLSTGFGWRRNSEVYQHGETCLSEDGWRDFVQGDCLYFHLQSNKLTMFSAKKNRRFILSDIPNDDIQYFIHFNLMRPGTKLTLEPLSSDELTRMYA